MTNSFENPSDERVGDILAAAREERGLTLKTVSETLHIRENYLKSVELTSVQGIPRGYITMILRTYASYLNLPANTLIEKFSEQCGLISQAPKTDDMMASKSRRRSMVRGGIVGFAVAAGLSVVGGLGLFLMNQSADESQGAAPVVAAQTPSNGAHESLFLALEKDAALAQLPLTLTAMQAAWLEVRGADGTIFRSRSMDAGEVYHPRIGAGWSVSAQNGGAFVWQVGDLSIGALGDEDVPVYAVDIDAVAAHAQSVAAPSLAAIVDGRPAR